MEEDSETLQSAGSLVGNRRAARNNALVFLGCKRSCASLLAALHQIISVPAQRAYDDYEPLLARTWPDNKLRPGEMGIDRDRARKIYRAQLIKLAQTSSLSNETAQALQLTTRNVTHPSEG